jgi:hypothetical protein
MTTALPAIRRLRYRLPIGRELRPRTLCVVMNLPTLITLTLVLAYPTFYAVYLSLHRVALADLRRGIFPFVGFDNYRRIFADPLFLMARHAAADSICLRASGIVDAGLLEELPVYCRRRRKPASTGRLGTESSQTRRWRELDSNRRSRGKQGRHSATHF